jgi:hypothetical protein
MPVPEGYYNNLPLGTRTLWPVPITAVANHRCIDVD